jgi:actin related protein 2/3 complex subunit 5
VVFKAICGIEDQKGDVDAICGQLSPSQIDTLMKYVYKGLQSPDTSAVMLKWHAKILEIGGVGSIVRAISERRTV